MIKLAEETNESSAEESPCVVRSRWWGLLAGALTALSWVLSIPPFEFAEAAYIAFVPLILWLYTQPSRRLTVVVALATGWVAWFAILVWLRHVTWFGTVALSGILAAIFMLWVLLARWLLPLWRIVRFCGESWPLREWRAHGCYSNGRVPGFYGAFRGHRYR